MPDDAAAFEIDLDTFLASCYADPLKYVLGLWNWGVGQLEHDTGPSDWQRAFLVDLSQQVTARAFDGHTPVMPIMMAIASGHGVGKSALSAWIVHWLMDTRADCKMKVTANTQTQLETSTWAAIQSWGQTKLTAPRWTVNSAAMYATGDRANWFCVPTSCKEENSQAFAGLHNRHSTTAYIFDEASTVPDGVIQVAMGGLTDGEPMMFLFGNPSRRSGQLYRAVFGSERDIWNSRVVNGWDHLRGEATRQLYQQWIDTYGEDSDYVRVRILGLPPNADELQFIDHARVLQATRNAVQPVAGDPLIVGVDVSGGGSAWTVARFRRGYDARSLPPIRLTGEQTIANDRQMVISRLAEALSTHPIDAMFIDSAFGAVIVSRLRQMGFTQVHEVSFGGPSSDPHDANQRAFMWRKLKEWLPTGCLSEKDQRLQDDCEAPGYHINKQNKLVLESKQDMQKRGVASPDDGDALALTFSMPVRIRGEHKRAPVVLDATWAGV